VGVDRNSAPYRLLCPARVARPHRAALHWGRSWGGVRRGWDHPNSDLPRPPPPPMSRRAEPCRPTNSPTTRPGRKQLKAPRILRTRIEPARVPTDNANAWGERVTAGPRSPFSAGSCPERGNPDDSQRARVTLALGYGRPPRSRPMASSPMRRLRKTGAVDQDGNVVTIPRLPSVGLSAGGRWIRTIGTA